MPDHGPGPIDHLTGEQEDAIREAIGLVESGWWNCNGGKSAHQDYIDAIIDLYALLGETCTMTPSGQPAKHSRELA